MIVTEMVEQLVTTVMDLQEKHVVTVKAVEKMKATMKLSTLKEYTYLGIKNLKIFLNSD